MLHCINFIWLTVLCTDTDPSSSSPLHYSTKHNQANYTKNHIDLKKNAFATHYSFPYKSTALPWRNHQEKKTHYFCIQTRKIGHGTALVPCMAAADISSILHLLNLNNFQPLYHNILSAIPRRREKKKAKVLQMMSGQEIPTNSATCSSEMKSVFYLLYTPTFPRSPEFQPVVQISLQMLSSRKVL